MSRALIVSSLSALAFCAPTVVSSAAATTAPAWLQSAVKSAVSNLGPITSITFIDPSGRFPRAVVTGTFTCGDCSEPMGAKTPTGTVAEYRFDGLTRHATDFALCPKAKGCGSSLCDGSRCTPGRNALDAAFAALDSRLSTLAINREPFSHETGTHPCHIYYPSTDGRYIPGNCTTSVRLLGAQTAAVTFKETWRPREYEYSTWVRLATRTHTWTVNETKGGWATRITSTGDPPPQLPVGSTG